jgi:nicotinamidase-related amidase
VALLGSVPRTAWRVADGRVDLRRGAHPPPGWELAAEPQPLIVDPAATGLVVVDMQNDFCHPRGWLASIGIDVAPARAPIEPLTVMIPLLRAAGLAVVWLNWGNRPDRANLPPNVLHVYSPDGMTAGIGDSLPGTGPVLEKGSWNAAIVDELQPDAADILVDKYRMSGFWDTPLDSILRNLGLSTLLFAGVNADQCVLLTLADAACVGYDCVMVTDCCATTSPRFCWDSTLYNVRQCFGFTTSSGAIRQALR